MTDQTIIDLRFGGLLHDLGKFAQRGLKENRKHPEVGKEFAENLGLEEPLPQIISNHHTPSLTDKAELVKIVQEADHLSASEREDDEEREEVTKRPLRSVFSYITGKEESYDPSDNERYHPISPVNIKSVEEDETRLYPKTDRKTALSGRTAQAQYHEMWGNMLNELKKLDFSKDDASFTTLYYMLKKYTSQVPSAAYYSVPDIALFDHLRSTSAIAECLYRSEDGKLLLIGGDLSGIQNFIFNVQSLEKQETQEGTAKRLRGKSFLINILAESVADYLVDRLDLSLASKLWCSGGHFYLLAPSGLKEKVESCVDEINQYLFDKYEGGLYFAISSIEFDKDEIHKDFPGLIEKLNDRCNVKKQKKFSATLDETDFVLSRTEGGPCEACGMRKKSIEPLCESCKTHEHIGQRLPKAEFLIQIEGNYEENKADIDLEGLNNHWIICRNPQELHESLDKIQNETNGKITIFSLNDSDFITESLAEHVNRSELDIALGFKFLGNSAPYRDEGEKLLKTFEDLGERIGFLRMDVDDLGAVVALGLQKASEEEDSIENKYTVSRVSTLSRFLNLFFLGHMNSLADEYELYVTYSGGDDLFLVGDWKDITKGALEIRKRFSKFTAENPNLTISGGISVSKPGFPIGRASQRAGSYLEDYSKKAASPARGKKMPEKDKLTVFNQTVPWSSNYSGFCNGFEDLLDKGEWLYELVEKNDMSMSFIYSIMNFRDMTFEKDEEQIAHPYDRTFVTCKEAEEKKRYIPNFKYLLARSYDSDEDLFDKLDKDIPKIVPWARIPVSWVSYKHREEV